MGSVSSIVSCRSCAWVTDNNYNNNKNNKKKNTFFLHCVVLSNTNSFAQYTTPEHPMLAHQCDVLHADWLSRHNKT